MYENVAHLYSDMLAFRRESLSPVDLMKKKLYSTYRKFDDEKGLAEYLLKNPLKAHEGYYTMNNRLVHGKQGYASVFFYAKDELEAYLTEHKGSISGYQGNCYSNWLYFDLESKSGPADMREKVEPFFEYLTMNKIQYVCFFSGNQGMHLYIPIELLEVPEEYVSKANVVCKIFSKMIAKQFPEMADVIDPQVYGINTVLRMPFTVNPKSGLMKTILTYKDKKFVRLENNIGSFDALSKAIWSRNPDLRQNIKPHWKLDVSYLNTAEPSEVKFDTYFPAPYGEKVCIYNVLNAKLAKGEHRHEAGLRLMSWYHKEKEFPQPFVWTFLETLNRKSFTDPLELSELKNIYKYVDTTSYNLCKDQFMEQFCPKTNVCPFWHTKVNGIKGASMIEAMKDLDADLADNGTIVDFGNMFIGMQLQMKPNRGMILTVIMGSKVGKTTFALNVALKSGIPTALFSYEIGKMGVLTLLAKMLGLDPYNKLDRIELIQKTKHIFIVDEGRTALQMIPNEVACIERNFKVKIEMVIMDYLGIIPVYDVNRAGRFITNQVERINTIAELLPEMVKKHKWLAVVPAQPTKGVEGGGKAILKPDSGKGGKNCIINKEDIWKYGLLLTNLMGMKCQLKAG